MSNNQIFTIRKLFTAVLYRFELVPIFHPCEKYGSCGCISLNWATFYIKCSFSVLCFGENKVLVNFCELRVLLLIFNLINYFIYFKSFCVIVYLDLVICGNFIVILYEAIVASTSEKNAYVPGYTHGEQLSWHSIMFTGCKY